MFSEQPNIRRCRTSKSFLVYYHYHYKTLHLLNGARHSTAGKRARWLWAYSGGDWKRRKWSRTWEGSIYGWNAKEAAAAIVIYSRQELCSVSRAHYRQKRHRTTQSKTINSIPTLLHVNPLKAGPVRPVITTTLPPQGTSKSVSFT